MVKYRAHEIQPPAAVPGTGVLLIGQMLIGQGPGLEGRIIDPNYIITVSSLRDDLGQRTVLNLADLLPGEDAVVLDQDYAEVNRLLDEVRRTAA